ncbi:MAG: L-aspartate oxidase [Alcaligenes sp.]
MQSGSTQTDVLIIGAGLAGTSLALSLPSSMNVTLLSSTPAPCGASPMALGGLAAVLSAEDSLEQHIEDTLEAGARHADSEAVRGILQAAAEAVHWLLQRQVPLDRTEDGQLHLTREGGHSQRRIVHAADASGYAIMQALSPQLDRAPHILQRPHCQALALRRNERGEVAGVDIFDKHTQRYETILADHVVLATGGLGSLYAHSTNPDGALGEGVALAWRAGAAIRDLEFVQFHPTCLHADGPTFLLTEALRGEGGYLLDAQGHRFMHEYDPRAELAPRDIVSRAIAAHMRQEGSHHVWLDVRHLGADTLQQHFPKALEEGLRRGLDLRQDWIPVAPAAHYSCGGVQTDLSGRTTVAGLYAVGEVACTGLHGANRLASNSLLECVVMGRAVAETIAASKKVQRSALVPGAEASNAGTGLNGIDNSSSSDYRPPANNGPTLPTLRHLMQEHVGLLRTGAGLTQALHTLEAWREQINHGNTAGACSTDSYDIDRSNGSNSGTESTNRSSSSSSSSSGSGSSNGNGNGNGNMIPRTLHSVTNHTISLHLDTAWLLVQAALDRPHSLGAHFRHD